MSNPQVGLRALPADHPFHRAPGKTPAELVADVLAYNRDLYGGFRMEETDDEKAAREQREREERERKEQEARDNAADDEVVIDGKTHKIADLQRIMADEKRQGKRSGQAEVLRDLGVESVDDAKALIAAAKKAREAEETEAQTKAREADERRAAADRDTATAAAERRTASLERALVRRGVADDDLDDAVTMLDRDVPKDGDADAIATAAGKLKERRPEMFDQEPGEVRTPAGQIPAGRPPASRNRPSGQPFGAGGLARAEKRWGKKGA